MKRGLVPGVPFVFSLLFSACTVGSHVFWQDSGYYLTAVRDFSLLYPHGFVLYLLVCKGWTFIAAPVFGFVLSVHLFSSLMAAAGAAFTALAARDFLRKAAPEREADLPAILAACLMSAGYCYGHAAIIAKTYALFYMLLALLLWILVIADKRRHFVGLGVVLGLSWAAHPAAALLVPGLLLYGWVRRDLIKTWGWPFFAGIIVLAALFAFSPCLLLPSIAARDSLNDFGDPRTLREIVSFVSGERFTRQENAFGFSLWRWVTGLRYTAEEYLVGLVFLGLGGVVLYRNHRGLLGLLAAWIVPVAGMTLLFQGEGQFDQWLVFVFIPMCLIAAAGIRRALEWNRGRTLATVGLAAVCLVAVNYPALNQRGYIWAEEYGRMLLRNLDPGSVVCLSRDDPLGICRVVQGLPGERTDLITLNSSLLGEPWLDERIHRKLGLRIPNYDLVRRLKSKDLGWEMVAVAAFASDNIGRVPAVFSDIRPAEQFLREDLIVTPAGMLWKVGPRSEQGINLQYWDYPVQPESIPRAGRKARGHWGYLTAEGTLMKPELYEDRFFLPLLWSKVRLADLYLRQDPSRALSDYQKIRALYPEAMEDARFAYHFGLASYTTGHRGEAAKTWEALLATKPPEDILPFVEFYMGELHGEAGRPAEAERHYRNALNAKPPPELMNAISERLQPKR